MSLKSISGEQYLLSQQFFEILLFFAEKSTVKKFSVSMENQRKTFPRNQRGEI